MIPQSASIAGAAGFVTSTMRNSPPNDVPKYVSGNSVNGVASSASALPSGRTTRSSSCTDGVCRKLSSTGARGFVTS